MIRFLAGRIAGAVLVLLVVSVVTFTIFQLLPRLTDTDLALYYTGRNSSPAQADAVALKFGFDQPVVTQFWTWLSGIFAGRDLGDGVTSIRCSAPCFGYSFQQNQSVLDMILRALPVTVSITAGAAVLWIILGVGSGMISAARRGTIFDRATTVVSLVGVSVPEFFSGMIVIYALTSGPGWLRAYPDGINYVPITEDPVAWFVNLIPVWFVVALLIAAIYTRLTRSTMLETMSEDYMLTARAKGLPPRQIIGLHGMRAVLPPIVTLIGLDLGRLLGGVVIIESLFSFPGLGRLTFDAISTMDLPVIMGVTLFSSIFIVIANLVVDLSYSALDPRVRRG